MKAQRSGGKPILPKRLCRDPHTVYCHHPYLHRGCCNCSEWNAGDRDPRHSECSPYLLPEEALHQEEDNNQP